MSKKKLLLKNMGSNWVFLAFSSAASLFLVPYLIGQVGLSKYGVWVLIAQAMNYISIINNGMMLATNRFTSYYHGNIKDINRFAASSFWLLLLVAISFTLLSLLISKYVILLFPSIPQDMSRDAQWVCILAGLSLGILMIQSCFGGLLKGSQLYVQFNVVSCFGEVLRVVLTVAMIRQWGSIVGIQGAILLSAVVTASILALVAHRCIRGLNLSPLNIDQPAIAELYRYTKHSIARAGSTIAVYSSMTLLIGWWGGSKDVAVYHIASRIPYLLRSFILGAQGVFLPAFTSIIARGNMSEARSLVEKGMKFSSSLTLYCATFLFYYSEAILELWLHGDVPDGAVQVMRVLIIAVIPSGMFDIWMQVLVGIGALRGLTLSAIAFASASIAGTILMLQFSGLFIALAPACVLLLAHSIRSAVWLPIYSCRITDVRILDHIRNSIAPPVASAVVVVGVLLIVDRIFGGTGFELRLVSILVSASISAMIFAFLTYRKEAIAYLNMIKRTGI